METKNETLQNEELLKENEKPKQINAIREENEITDKQESKIKKIMASYDKKTLKENDLDKLNKLDKKVKRPAKIFGYTFGTLGTLILGFGMSIALGSIINIMGLGIAVGIVGIIAVSINYPIYKHILNKRKAKYSEEILLLSSQLLNA